MRKRLLSTYSISSPILDLYQSNPSCLPSCYDKSMLTWHIRKGYFPNPRLMVLYYQRRIDKFVSFLRVWLYCVRVFVVLKTAFISSTLLLSRLPSVADKEQWTTLRDEEQWTTLRDEEQWTTLRDKEQWTAHQIRQRRRQQRRRQHRYVVTQVRRPSIADRTIYNLIYSILLLSPIPQMCCRTKSWQRADKGQLARCHRTQQATHQTMQQQ